MSLQLFGKFPVGLVCLGHHKKTAGILIDPMYDSGADDSVTLDRVFRSDTSEH